MTLCTLWIGRFALALAALLAAGCATVPTGPSTVAIPGTSKGWDQFQADDSTCRGFAANRAGVPNEAAAAAGVGSAAVGTVLGAAVGGLLGGSNGAAVGAGMGLFTGGIVGANNAQIAGSETQRRYDQFYFQCMYAHGNRVPAPAGFVQAPARSTVATTAGTAAVPTQSRGSAPPPNAAIPPPNTPPPSAASNRAPVSGAPSNGAPPDAAVPPPGTPPPDQLTNSTGNGAYRLPR